MSRRKLGTYALGDDWIRVCYDVQRSDGIFYVRDKRMVVGLCHDLWRDVLDVLLHETLEYCLTRLNLAYEPMDQWTQSTSSRSFIMDHNQFTEACAMSAPFLTFVQPALATVYNKAQKRRKKKGGKA